ncbi:MAG: YihY family inner membrane protein [Duodenibacillus sp.]|nr:YihY family inner membrane protein [Duodenibacillus sp.]
METEQVQETAQPAEQPAAPRPQRSRRAFMSDALVLCRFTLNRAAELQIAEVSSSMALTTITGLVPLLALAMAIFAAFPAFEPYRHALESAILGSFLPEQYSAQIIVKIKEFAAHAAGLTTFGVIGLAVTVFFLIDKIFKTVNGIFKLRTTRPLAQRALIYWALMTIGPVMLAFSMTVTAKITAGVSAGVSSAVTSWLLPGFDILVQALMFGVVYKLIPNCRVKFTHAFMGGLVVSIGSMAVKKGFAYYVGSGTLASIYGAFVALPVLIIWIYAAWLLFFAGAAVTATIPKLAAGRLADGACAGNDFFTGLVMLQELTAMQLRGEPAVLSGPELCALADTYPEACERVLDTMRRAGYVAKVDGRSARDAWALVVDSRQATLKKAFEAFAADGANTLVAERLVDDPGVARGKLHDWWARLSDNEALTLPMSRAFGKAP